MGFERAAQSAQGYFNDFSAADRGDAVDGGVEGGRAWSNGPAGQTKSTASTAHGSSVEKDVQSSTKEKKAKKKRRSRLGQAGSPLRGGTRRRGAVQGSTRSMQVRVSYGVCVCVTIDRTIWIVRDREPDHQYFGCCLYTHLTLPTKA